MFLRRVLCIWITVSFIASSVMSPQRGYAQTVLNLPEPGTMVHLTAAYAPVLIKGLKINPANPLALDFIVATGDSQLSTKTPFMASQLRKESQKLIKYFFAALTLPEKDTWVNLSPYEKDRIVPKLTGETEMGRDMLAQDYILKQITASLIYPEKGIGKEFWDRIYSEASKRFGTTQIPVNTFNKVWIVADKASVYEAKDTVFVVSSHLKVMLEEDYLASQKHQLPTPMPTWGHVQQEQRNVSSSRLPSNEALNMKAPQGDPVASQLIREILLPALEKEVNEGKNFANLRQIFHSLILAKWYKETLKTALLNQVYSNKNKVGGLSYKDLSSPNVVDPAKGGASVGDPQYIYQQYLKAYKKGVFNYIKEDIDQATQQPLPRKYFSGGVDTAMIIAHASTDQAMQSIKGLEGRLFEVRSVATADLNVSKKNVDAAMNAQGEIAQEALSVVEVDGWEKFWAGDKWDELQGKSDVVIGDYLYPPARVYAALRFLEDQINSMNIITPSRWSFKRPGLQVWSPELVFNHPYYLYVLAQVANALAQEVGVEFWPKDSNTISAENLPQFYLPKGKSQEKSFGIISGQMKRLLGNWQNLLISRTAEFSIPLNPDLVAEQGSAASKVVEQKIFRVPYTEDVPKPSASSQNVQMNQASPQPTINTDQPPVSELPAPSEEPKVEIPSEVVISPASITKDSTSKLKTQKDEIIMLSLGHEEEAINDQTGKKVSVKIFWNGMRKRFIFNVNRKEAMAFDIPDSELKEDQHALQVAVAGRLIFVKEISTMKIYKINENNELVAVALGHSNEIKDLIEAMRIQGSNLPVKIEDNTIVGIKEIKLRVNGRIDLYILPVGSDQDYQLPVREFYRRVFNVDLAMGTTSSSAAFPGGIDLNAARLNMQKTGSGADIKFDPAMIEQFKLGHFDGIVPVITGIWPITNVYPLLGLKEPEESNKAAA